MSPHANKGADNRALIAALLAGTGIRASELCGLRIRHLVLDVEEPYVRVTGKGGAVRDCPLPPEVATILEAYITTRHERTKRRAGRDAPVWLNGRGKPLTPSALDHHVRRKGHIKRKARQCALRRTAGSKVPSIPYLRSGMEPCGEPVTPPDARVGRRPVLAVVMSGLLGAVISSRLAFETILTLASGLRARSPLAFLGPFVDCGAAAALYLAAEDGFLSAKPAARSQR